jgi:acetylornithine deacetylase/succinyl-diaminopimelate desuccinylase-like protein
MKSSIAALVIAAKTLKAADFPLKGTLVLAFVGDEEIGQTGVRSLGSHDLQADFALVAEATSLIPVIAHKGRQILEVSSLGKTAHSAIPETGINAIEHVLFFLDYLFKEFKDFNKIEHPFLGIPTFNLTTIKGGTSINSVPDQCNVTIDIRYLPDQDPNIFEQEILNIAKAYHIRRPEATIKWNILYSSPALECPKDMPLVQSLRRGIQHFTGHDPGVRGMVATTDAGVLYREMGIPTVVCGPGDLSQAHQPDEHIEITELYKAAQTYTWMIREVMHE